MTSMRWPWRYDGSGATTNCGADSSTRVVVESASCHGTEPPTSSGHTTVGSRGDDSPTSIAISWGVDLDRGHRPNRSAARREHHHALVQPGGLPAAHARIDREPDLSAH